MEEYTQFTMRMETGLYEQLKESAKKNKRSIAKELEYLTDYYLNHNSEINLPNDIAKQFIDFIRHSLKIQQSEQSLNEENILPTFSEYIENPEKYKDLINQMQKRSRKKA